MASSFSVMPSDKQISVILKEVVMQLFESPLLLDPHESWQVAQIPFSLLVNINADLGPGRLNSIV